MKKYLFLPVLLCLCACTGNKTNHSTALTASENTELQETVVSHLDSLAGILCDSTQPVDRSARNAEERNCNTPNPDAQGQ